MKHICVVCDKEFHDSHANRKACSRECSGVAKSQLYSGRNNPNCQYKELDDNLMDVIDSKEKAYFLGWVASDGSIDKNTKSVTIEILDTDRRVLEDLRDVLFPGIPVKINRLRRRAIFRISSSEIGNACCKHLKIVPGKKSFTVRFPDSCKEDRAFGWAFLKGLFEGDGHVNKVYSKSKGSVVSPRCEIASSSEDMKKDIIDFVDMPTYANNHIVAWTGVNALDFLGNIYKDDALRLSRKYDAYLQWCTWNPALPNQFYKVDNIRWSKTDSRAVKPFKSRVSDSGYDLTLISEIKRSNTVIFYDTGLKVAPPFGYYFDLVPRSSLAKSGYILANCVGVIDRAYTGSIKVALMKIDVDAPELELPARVVQVILRPIIHVDMDEVEDIEDSSRGSGSFGSTGV